MQDYIHLGIRPGIRLVSSRQCDFVHTICDINNNNDDDDDVDDDDNYDDDDDDDDVNVYYDDVNVYDDADAADADGEHIYVREQHTICATDSHVHIFRLLHKECAND
jgi:hypothetical protein